MYGSGQSDIITGLENREVGFLWIVATNPVVTMPDLERTKAALTAIALHGLSGSLLPD